MAAESRLTYAIITPSFRGDFERCKLLCESLRIFGPPDAPHFLLVDRRDEQLFRSLVNRNTHLLLVEEVLGIWCRRIPWLKRWWLTKLGIPVRSWILQQIAKLAVATVLKFEFYLFIDSDVCLANYLDINRFRNGNKVALFRIPAVLPAHDIWHRNGAKLLGVREKWKADRGYVGNLITWRHDTLCNLYERLQVGRIGSWQMSIARTLHFSEYTLYGRFVETLRADYDNHFLDSSRRCHELWAADVADPSTLSTFLASYQPQWPAIMISSKAGFEVKDYRSAIEGIWRRNAKKSQSPERETAKE